MKPKLEVALTKCFYCGEDDRIVMNKMLTDRYANAVKEMHGKIVDTEPCQKCADFMKQVRAKG